MSPILARMLVCALVLTACAGGSKQSAPPPAPGGLQAAPGDGVVALRWDAAAGAERYTVYWSTAAGVTRSGGTAVETEATSLEHTGLMNGVAHHYVVTAWNAAGESPASAEVSATPIAAHQPLTVTRAGTGGGTVSSTLAGIDCGALCTASLDTGSSITLSATPDATSTFDGWTGDCAGADDCALTMDAPRSATATFTRITRLLTVERAGTGGGTITSSPAGIDCGATCQASYDLDSVVELTATPAATSTFDGWSGPCSGTGTCTVTLDQARSVTATFTLMIFQLETAVTPGGTITSDPAGIDCWPTCTASYDAGTRVTLTAHPASSGGIFIGWYNACSGKDLTCTVTMDQARTAVGMFSWLLTVSKAGTGGGTVTSTNCFLDCGSICSCTTTPGYTMTIKATPDATSTFTGWSGDCSGTGDCILPLTTGRSITATFDVKPTP